MLNSRLISFWVSWWIYAFSRLYLWHTFINHSWMSMFLMSSSMGLSNFYTSNFSLLFFFADMINCEKMCRYSLSNISLNISCLELIFTCIMKYFCYMFTHESTNFFRFFKIVLCCKPFLMKSTTECFISSKRTWMLIWDKTLKLYLRSISCFLWNRR